MNGTEVATDRDEVIRQLGVRILQLGVYNTMLVRVGRTVADQVVTEITLPAMRDWSCGIDHPTITLPEGKLTREGSIAVRQMITGELSEVLDLAQLGLALKLTRVLGADLRPMPAPETIAGMSTVVTAEMAPVPAAFLYTIEPLDNCTMPNFF